MQNQNLNLKITRQLLNQFLILLICLGIFCSATASIKSYKREADGITFLLDKGSMKVKVCKDDIIEVKYTSLKSMPAKNSLVINNPWLSKPVYSVSEKGDEIIISTKKIKIRINKTSNAIIYTDLHDNVIVAEDGTR